MRNFLKAYKYLILKLILMLVLTLFICLTFINLGSPKDNPNVAI